MNRIFTAFLFLVLVTMNTNVNAQAVRKVLIEEWTSATCPPCASTNPLFDPLLASYGQKLVVLKYQSYIPVTGDPMYGANTTESQARHTYYGINSAPSSRIDGKTNGNGHPILFVQDPTPIDTRLAVTSPIEMSVEHSLTLDNGKDSLEITVNIKNVSSTDFTGASYFLQVAITEKDIRFPKQAATNGEIEFSNVMRKMVPNASGTKLVDPIAPGATKTITFKVAKPAYIYSLNQLGVVAFVQNNATTGADAKSVIQAAESFAVEPKGTPYYDVAMTLATVKNRISNCDATISYEMTIENLSTGTDTIKSIDFIQLNSGAARPKVTWNGVLLPGQKVVHTINNLAIAFGAATFNMYIDKINNGTLKDVNVINNFKDQTSFLTFPAGTIGTTLSQSFETGTGTTASPNTYFISNGLRIFRASAAQGSNFPTPLGGFGQSVWNVFFAFSDGGVGPNATLVIDKLDLSGGKKTQMEWNYAYAVKEGAGSTDNMEIAVSSDCGDSWTVVYSKSGEDLASVPNVDVVNSHIPGFWLPLPDQWKQEKLDLSAFDGTPELMIRFKGTAGGGWGYFLDDVNVKNASGVNVQDAGIISSMNVFPNPVNDQINLELRMAESAKAAISLYDMNGKRVAVLGAEKNLNSGFNTLSFPVNLESGLYQLEVRTAKGIQTQKITVF
jgi:hypothetical protein